PDHGDAARLCGLFLNTVPLRVRLRPGSWLDLARQAFRAELDLMPHRRYPLARLQEEHGPGPLFETTFNFTHFHVIGGAGRSGGLRYVGERVGTDPARRSEPTNLALVAGFLCDPTSPERILLALDYSPRALAAGQAARVGGYYLAALRALAEEPGAPHDAAC